jgi:putative RecB family exonuclease
MFARFFSKFFPINRVENDMPSFSHSRIGTFETCRLQYRYRYIDRVKVEVEDTVEAFLGSMVHETLEALYSHVRFSKIMTLEELLEDFDIRWRQRWKDSIRIVREDYSADNYRRMGEGYLRKYYARYYPFDDGRIIGLETQNYLSLDDEGKHKFHIRIDRLMDMGEGLYEVHDYKTNMSLPSQEDLDGDRQLAMYSLWVRRQFKDFKRVRLVWHFLAFDKEMESFRTADELENLRRQVLAKIQEIEKEESYPPRESALCGWCLYRDICPLWKHEAAVEALPEAERNRDSGVGLVDEYVRVKEQFDRQQREGKEALENLKEAVIDFCRREGVRAIAGSEYRISITEAEKVGFPAKNSPERRDLMEILHRAGRLDEVVDLDTSALSRILQDKDGLWEEELLERLRIFVKPRTEIRLNIRKKKT